MSAYAVANIDVTDAKAFQRYITEVPATVAKYGGRYLVRGGKIKLVEGDWNPKILVVIEFPTMDALKAWYDSEDYRPLRSLRLKTARTTAAGVWGVREQPH